ncbi:Ankyrin repeat-containing-like protein [Theobroma cacao]|uniref:Ankyrin repeat-containing-like protein n=1 Tax=Theobroma cacao TaxID=3641 RepID=A0A061GL73_THECC|nr:Ankyrin repeat-containing-like protein [Theobroma cacao]
MASSSSQAPISKPGHRLVALRWKLMETPKIDVVLSGQPRPRSWASKFQYALHVAVGTGKANDFVTKLVKGMSPEDLEIANQSKVTALTIAAAIGNTDAAKLLVSINPNLPHIQDGDEGFPVHRAAQSGHKETLVYLLKVTRDDVQPSPFENNSGVWLLRQIIFVGFYVRSSAFRSSSELTLCQRFLYSLCGAVRQKLHRALWDLIDSLVPQVKHIRQMKFMHGEALRLVKLLCTEAERLDPQKAANIFADPLFQAVSHGIPEIIENILVSFPIAVQFRDNDGRNIIERAVLYRRHNVFNLIYRMNRQTKHALAEDLDRFQTNILHLAGILAPQDQLNLVSSAALQMQRELQWFKEVEKLVPSIYRDARNYEGKTPRMVFTDKHKELVKEGEKWMKDTANSCSVVAALIATVVFAAAITVPGGTNGDSGFPVFSSEKAFVIFAVSDALSLFSSTAAILMFLSILTARYAGDNFLQALPKRLIMGLLTLLISITTMMIAFSATLYLVFGNDETWILTSVAASACLLVILFVYLQFSLLVDMFSSIYGHGIFGQRSEEPLC